VHQPTEVPGYRTTKRNVASASCAVVPGTTIRGTVALRIATIMRRRIATTILVFAVSVCLRALPAIRTGKWEFIGRIQGSPDLFR
jgi:hypothetical protein